MGVVWLAGRREGFTARGGHLFRQSIDIIYDMSSAIGFLSNLCERGGSCLKWWPTEGLYGRGVRSFFTTGTIGACSHPVTQYSDRCTDGLVRLYTSFTQNSRLGHNWKISRKLYSYRKFLLRLERMRIRNVSFSHKLAFLRFIFSTMFTHTVQSSSGNRLWSDYCSRIINVELLINL